MSTRSTRLAPIAFALVIAIVVGAGCTPPAAVGAPCDLGVPMTMTGGSVTISSPALECEGRVCVQVGTAAALCTAECKSDDDCRTVAPGNGDACHQGFTCAAATAIGSYACRPLCICRDALPATVACTASP